MKKISIIFLQAAVMFVGVAVFIFMLWEPHVEGRNVNTSLFEMYFNDPFLAYVYASSILFFVALFQMLVLLKSVEQGVFFSLKIVKSIQTIKYCAMSLVVFIVLAEAYFFIIQSSKDDIAGGVMIGLFLILVSTLVAAIADVLEGVVLSVINKKL